MGLTSDTDWLFGEFLAALDASGREGHDLRLCLRPQDDRDLPKDNLRSIRIN